MEKTLKNAWKLTSENGRQRWLFDENIAKEITATGDENEWIEILDQLFIFDKKSNPNAADAILRGKSTTQKHTSRPKDAKETLQRGVEFFMSIQQEEGNWAGDYGGPLFLLPGLIFVLYITDTMPPREKQVLMKRYLLNHQNKDGGWGLHIEDESTMFGTALNYVALILLGNSMEDEVAQKAVNWIHQNGGLEGIPPWGKLYLALLGLYDWKGLDALLPELWLLPKKLPFYPGNYWNHARMVYLPMSYLSGIRFKMKENELIIKLRNQLYNGQFDTINWGKARRKCCVKDDYFPESKRYRFVSKFLNTFNNAYFPALRKRALRKVYEKIKAEDINTNYVNLGPVNKALNMLVNFIEEGKSSNFNQHLERVDDYLWLSEDGIKMNGYNGSQFWDTAFMAHALMERKEITLQYAEILNKIEHFVDYSMVRNNVFECKKFDRSTSKGGWPFSTIEHGWPITDCTSEGMRVVLLLEKKGLLKNKNILQEIKNSVNFILENQNKDGGWASYEKTKGPKWLEKMNPSRIFGEIMVDYSYVECTSACVQGLKSYAEYNPSYKKRAIQTAIQNGIEFILRKQKENGLWYGSWAVCFTNATWFAIEALVNCGNLQYDKNDGNNPITQACDKLVSLQKDDGSWGESYLSSVKKEYIQHQEGQVVNTAWALMTLMASNYSNKSIVEKGIQFLVDKQLLNGDWPQQGISGVFNHNCMITYINYRNIFPIWAIERFVQNQF